MHRAFRHLRTFLALALVAVVFVGCSDSSGDDPTRLVIRNNTSEEIWFVYFSSCSATEWGDDRLGAAEIIEINASRTWTLAPGCWDMKAETESGAEVTRFDEQIDRGETFTWTVTD